MHEKITDIQNTFWKAYKTFGQDKDIKKWEDTILSLKERYQFQESIISFIDGLVYAWVPIIQNMKAWSS